MKTSLHPITLSLPPSRAPRTEGIHLSGIIRAIAIESGVLKPEWAEMREELPVLTDRAITDPTVIARIAIGLAWEEWYISTQLPHVIDHPGELCLQDVFMTPDGESVDTVLIEGGGTRHQLAIHEVKATYKSLKTIAPRLVTHNPSDPDDLETQWMWLAQTKGYCKAADTTLAYLHVLLLCGDYTYPMRPMVKCWRIEYTQEELDLNWELISDYHRYRLRIAEE